MIPIGPELAVETVAWAEQCLMPRARVVRAVRLGGRTGPWSLRVRRSTNEFTVVLRIGDPRSVDDRRRLRVESAALRVAGRFAIAAPRLVACDLTGREASQLAVLSTHLRGTNTIPTTASPDRLVALGRAAASLSSTRPDDEDLPVRRGPLADLDFRAERAAGASTPLLDEADRYLDASDVTPGANVLVHGDCWQGNMLWSGDTFTGFVDWDAAGVGPPGLDLGSLRFDAALYYGPAGLHHITTGWTDGGGPAIDDLAHWDIAAALASPADLTAWLPTIAAPGRHDLDLDTITSRRDAFLSAALRNGAR